MAAAAAARTPESMDLDAVEARLTRALAHVEEIRRLEAGGGPRQLARAAEQRMYVALYGWEIAADAGLVTRS